MTVDKINNQQNDITPLLNAISEINNTQVKSLIFTGKFNQAILLHRKEISQLIDNLMNNTPKGKVAELGQIKIRFEEFDQAQKMKSFNFEPTLSKPHENELSTNNTPQEEIFKRAIYNNNIEQVQYCLNDPDYQNILIDKKEQVFNTIENAKEDLKKYKSLTPTQREDLKQNYNYISNIIAFKIYGTREFVEIDLNDAPMPNKQSIPKELSDEEKRANISKVIKSKNIEKLTDLLTNKDSMNIMIKYSDSIIPKIEKEIKALQKKSNSPEQIKALKNLKGELGLQKQIISSNDQSENTINPEKESIKSTISNESKLTKLIKEAISDLINAVKEFLKSNDITKALNENSKLLDNIRNQAQKYSISDVRDSSSPSSSTSSQKKPSGGREL